MANNTVQIGSQGRDVKTLQELLNKNGYSLDEDGIFGEKTLSAVKNFQGKNGLAVDGIAGVNTWSALTGTPAAADTTSDFQYKEFTYDPYNESDIVSQAKQALDTQLAQKPGEYNSQWQGMLNETINKILNREKFSYDLNGDALYQQYKDKYTKKGKMAMQDTMGQAAAMTGGYGSSYAQSVGQQAYNASLEQLNDIVPELYQMAYDRYNQEGQDLYNQYSMLGAQEEMEYGRHRDKVADWMTERDYLANRYDAERDYDYSKYTDNRDFDYGKYSDDKSYAYQNHRDAITDEQWRQDFEEAKWQFDQKMKLNNAEFDYKRSNSASNAGNNSNNNQSNNSYTPPVVNQSAKVEVDFNSELNKLIASGAKKSEINTYLRKAMQDGLINNAQYNYLKEQYAPRGYAY